MYIMNMKIKDYTAVMYLLMTTLCTHGLALLNTHVYWDGVLLSGFYQENNLEQLRLLCFSMGIPLFYYIIRLLWWLGNGFIINVFAVASIYLVALFTYKSARLFKSINQSTALIISAFIIIYPGSMITVFHAVINYYIMYALFFVAFYLGLKFELQKISNDKHTYTYLFSSLILFFLSFSMKSLLLYYLLFLICAYIIYSEESLVLFLKPHQFISFLYRRWYYLILPITFWLICQVFYKPYGDYSSYNQFQSFSIGSFTYYFIRSLEFATLRILWVPSLIFLFFYCCYSCIYQGNKHRHKIIILSNHPSRIYILLFIFGAIALTMAISPYILVGKPVIYDSLPDTRFAMLVPSAVALLISSFIGLFLMRTDGRLLFIGKVFIAIFVIYFELLWLNNYLRLEAEASFKDAVVLQLKSHQSWANYSIYWVELHGFNKNYELSVVPYEWAAFFNDAYGGHSRYALLSDLNTPGYFKKLKESYTKYEKERHNVRNLNVNGCQAILNIHPGTRWPDSKFTVINDATYANKYEKILYNFNPGYKGFNSITLGLKFLYYRLIQPKKLNTFLSELVHIELVPHLSQEATDCKHVTENA